MYKIGYGYFLAAIMGGTYGLGVGIKGSERGKGLRVLINSILNGVTKHSIKTANQAAIILLLYNGFHLAINYYREPKDEEEEKDQKQVPTKPKAPEHVNKPMNAIYSGAITGLLYMTKFPVSWKFARRGVVGILGGVMLSPFYEKIFNDNFKPYSFMKEIYKSRDNKVDAFEIFKKNL